MDTGRSTRTRACVGTGVGVGVGLLLVFGRIAVDAIAQHCAIKVGVLPPINVKSPADDSPLIACKIFAYALHTLTCLLSCNS